MEQLDRENELFTNSKECQTESHSVDASTQTDFFLPMEKSTQTINLIEVETELNEVESAMYSQVDLDSSYQDINNTETETEKENQHQQQQQQQQQQLVLNPIKYCH